MRILVIAATTTYLMFIAWVIGMAGTGTSSVFFDVVKAVPCGDRIGHVLLFGLLTLGLNVSFDYRSVPCGNTGLQLGSCLVIALTIAEELSQRLYPARTFDIVDIAANLAGIALFSGVSHYLQGRQHRSTRAPCKQVLVPDAYRTSFADDLDRVAAGLDDQE